MQIISPRIKNLLNQKFGRLTVIELTDKRTKPGGVIWKCLCICGNTREVSSNNLQQQDTTSCGCYWIEKRRGKPGYTGLTHLIQRYRNGAKDRNLSFELSREDIQEIVQKSCFYCGKEPSQFSYGGGITKEAIANSKFIYNGIDRLNNKLGYFKKNCVPCCKRCNYSKHTMSYTEFKQWINTLYNRLCKLKN
ncbi:MAG: hypothetical protein V3U54_08965 [Thermodesulfobacteriota bacterium]